MSERGYFKKRICQSAWGLGCHAAANIFIDAYIHRQGPAQNPCLGQAIENLFFHTFSLWLGFVFRVV